MLMSRDMKHLTNEKELQLSSLAARGLFSSLPGASMMNDYSTISALSAAMMNAAANSSLSNATCLPPSASLFNNNQTPSSLAAAVANLNNLNNLNNFNNMANQSNIPPQSSPSTTPLNGTNQTNNSTNTPPTNLNSFALNGLDQAVNYHLQHPSPYIQW